MAANAFLELGVEHFDVEYRFDALEDWLDYLDNPHAAGLAVDGARLRQAENALRRGDCILIALESWTAAAFRRPVVESTESGTRR